MNEYTYAFELALVLDILQLTFAGYLAFLNLRFLIWRLDMISLIMLWAFNEINTCKGLVWHLTQM